MEEFLTHFGYWGIFLVLAASGAGLPFPEDIPLIFGGYLCASGLASLEVMIPFTFVTVLGADTLLYLIGRKYGRHVPNLPMFRRFLTPQRLAAAEMAFHTHGGKTLFTSRFVPGVRAAVFFTAGVFKIPMWKFLLFDGAAALLSVPLLVLVGYWGASHIDKVKDAAFTTQLCIGLIIATAILLILIRKRRNKKALQAKLLAMETANPDNTSTTPSADLSATDPSAPTDPELPSKLSRPVSQK